MTEDTKRTIDLSRDIYEKDAITATAYKFTDKYYINIDISPENKYRVRFKAKKQEFNLEKIIDNFCNELIDQQVRIDIGKKFAKIRDELVKKAFSPISK